MASQPFAGGRVFAPGDLFSLGVVRFRLTVGRGPGADTGEPGDLGFAAGANQVGPGRTSRSAAAAASPRPAETESQGSPPARLG